MNSVVQEERTGCGIACAAALAGVSYGSARNTAAGMGIYAADTALWSDTAYMRRLLGCYGLRAAAGETPFSSWETLPDLCLLAIKWRQVEGTPFWHWVVFYRNSAGDAVVLDSKKALKTNTRRDFWRMKPKWHISVCKESSRL